MISDYIKISLLAILICSITACKNSENESTTRIIRRPISVGIAHNLMIQNEDRKTFYVIDCQPQYAYSKMHLNHAIHIPYSENTTPDLTDLPSKGTYIIYSENDKKSQQLMAVMADLNFSELYTMTGGIQAWKAAGFPVTKGETK